MIDYANGKIYKLVNSVDDTIYVGSTCQLLSKRKSRHKSLAPQRPNRPVYAHLNSIGWDNVDIILIENCSVSNKEQLHARERHYIDLLKPSLNVVKPGRTKAEYKRDHAEHFKKISKEYRERNKEHLSQQKKEYYKNNKERLGEYYKEWAKDKKDELNEYRKEWYEKNKAEQLRKQKEYREKNADKVKEQYRQKYLRNRDKLREKAKESLMCSYCDYEVRKCKMTRHIKSQRHATNYKKAFLDCFGEEYTGEIPLNDY